MDAKVTVEGCRCCKDRHEPHTYEHDLIAMRNIIHGAILRSEALAAMERLQEAFAERDAQIAGTELMLRKEWWLNHRCPISAAYGDDGEMQCNAACCMKDFKREPLDVLATHVWQRRLAKATEDMTLLEEARAQIAEMQKITGPKCPKCGHWLKAEHTRHYRGGSNNVYDDFFCEPCSEGLQRGISHCEIGLVDLLTNYPLIAAELGLEANDEHS